MNISLYKKNKIKIIEFVAFFIVALTFIYFLIPANRDLVNSFSLFMDERISYDGVSNILQSKGISDFIWSISDGGDHRYGRIFWNSIALFVFLPEYFYGEFGQIFYTRMFQALILIISFFIITRTFIQNSFLRIFLFFCLLNIPFSHYYATMPKPEPIQLLFISIFLFYYRKLDMKLDSFYWIFIGLAFGAKISTLPLIIIFIIPGIFKLIYFKDNQLLEKYVNTFFYFVFGLVLAVPILALPVSLSFIFYFIIIKTFKLNIYRKISLIFSIIFINLFTSLLLFFKHNITTGFALWGGSTFLNTTHGSNDSDIGILDWFEYLFYGWFNAPAVLLIFIFIMSTILIIRYINNSFSINFSQNSQIPVLLILAGIFSSLLIFLTVDRLWGFYLFINSVLILVGIFSIIEKNIFDKTFSNTFNNYLSKSLLLIFIITSIFFWVPNNYQEYNSLSKRTQSITYFRNYESYKQILNFIEQLPVNDKKYSITYDPSLFMLPQSPNYDVNLFWGYLVDWNKDIDIIILNKNHTPDADYVPALSSLDYESYIIEKEQYELLVNVNSSCKSSDICFEEVLKLSNKGVILLKH